MKRRGRGGFLHGRVLLAPIEAWVDELGGVGYREFPTKPGRDAGFIDLWITTGTERIACEAELTADRVAGDVAKAKASNATLLLIVVPTAQVARSIRKRLKNLTAQTTDCGFDIWVLPLGVALERLANSSRFRTSRNVSETSDPK